MDPSANKGNIKDTGEQLMFSITGGTKKEKTMDEKCLADCCKKLGGKSAVKSKSLGPISDATAKHSEKVYHTVQNRCGNDLPLEQWGLKISSGMCLPMQMTKPPALHELLKIIRCGCKIECTAQCTCITYELKCTSICNGCGGAFCQNCVFNNLDVEV